MADRARARRTARRALTATSSSSKRSFHRRHVRRLLDPAVRWTAPPISGWISRELRSRPRLAGSPQVSMRPEPFGALLVPLRHQAAVLPQEPAGAGGGQGSARPPQRPGGVSRLRRAAAELPAYERALAALADSKILGTGRCTDSRPDIAPLTGQTALTLPAGQPGSRRPRPRPAAHRPVPARAGCSHLPDLGAAYACNLSCVHCLSSSAAATTARAEHR